MSGTETWLDVRVVAKKIEAVDICSFELANPTGALELFAAGSHVDVEISPGLVRQYSLIEGSEHIGTYRIAVLREPLSRGGSKTLSDTIDVGDHLRISKPRNLFELNPEATKVLLIAGGIGITPILSMARRLQAGAKTYELHYSARSKAHMAFHDDIARSSIAGHASLYFSQSDGTNRMDLPAMLANPSPGHHLYVCGPKRLVDETLLIAQKANWPPNRIHREVFQATSVSEEDRGSDSAFSVELARSGRVIVIPKDKTIVDALADAGIIVPVSCQQGVCGSCLTRVLDGIPEHRDFFMMPDEHAANNLITPCCSRSKSLLLVLDL